MHAHRVGQHRLLGAVFRADIGPTCDQQFDDRYIPIAHGVHQRHVPEAVAAVDVGARIKQQADALHAAALCGEVKRIRSLRVCQTDEVMAGLNPTEINEVVHLIERLNADGRTFLVIEHNLKVVRRFSHRVVVLDRGAKLAEGTAEQVLDDPRVIEAYVGKGRRA